MLSQLYDYENVPCRKDFRRLREVYNGTSKASQIVKKRIEKMRSQVDKLKVEVERDEVAASREIDFSKLMGKGQPPATNNHKAKN